MIKDKLTNRKLFLWFPTQSQGHGRCFGYLPPAVDNVIWDWYIKWPILISFGWTKGRRKEWKHFTSPTEKADIISELIIKLSYLWVENKARISHAVCNEVPMTKEVRVSHDIHFNDQEDINTDFKLKRQSYGSLAATSYYGLGSLAFYTPHSFLSTNVFLLTNKLFIPHICYKTPSRFWKAAKLMWSLVLHVQCAAVY